MGVFDALGQSIATAFGSKQTGPPGGAGSPVIISGPLTTPKGDPIPYFGQQRATVRVGALTSGATLFTKTPYLRVTSPAQAAQEYFQREPGQEIVSRAPGAADLWRTLAEGFLPTLRPPGQTPMQSEASGFAQGLIGQTAPGAGMGLPQWSWYFVGAGALVALYLGVKYVTRKR